MNMTKNTEPDKTAVRLTEIFKKFNAGEKSDPKKLALELNVTVRTIQHFQN
jgi:hypothetical protein